jgi:uncharacterized membrane protein
MEAFRDIVNVVGYTIEALGIIVIVTGAIASLMRYVQRRRRHPDGEAYHGLRRELGRSIIIGLEFLIAGDIIRTVATDYTMTNLAGLAIIILIRTFLSLTLFLEVEGRWPWQPARPDAAAS